MTKRLKLHDIDTAGANDGDVVGYDPDTDEWAPMGLGGGGITGLTSHDASVDITDNGDGTLDLATSGGSGGGGTGMGPDGKPTINTPPAEPNDKDDEFNDGSGMSGPATGLNAKWSKRNMGTAGWAVLDDSKAPGCFMFDIPAGQATTQALYQAAPSGDFRLAARVMRADAGDRQMWGLFVLDSSGNGVSLMLDDPSGDSATRLRAPAAWGLASGSLAVVSTAANSAWASGQAIYLSLRKAGGVYFGAAWTADRILPAIVGEVSATPTSFIPAYVGFGRGFGGATSKVLLDWARFS